MSVKVDIYFDTRTLRKKTEDYPYKLRIYAGKSKLYPTIFGLSIKDNDKLKAKNLRDNLQDVRDKLKEIEDTALAFIKNMDPFSFDIFERDFIKDHPGFEQARIKFQPLPAALKKFDFGPYYKNFPVLLENPEPGSIGEIFKLIIEKKISKGTSGSIKTAVGYRTAYSSLLKFGGNVKFKTITAEYVQYYSDWLKYNTDDKKTTCGKTTVGIYTRKLRAVFNEAIRLKRIKKENCYPFGKGQFGIPASSNLKKAFTLDEIEQIYYYACDPKEPSMKKAKAFWLFMYFGQGLNPKDIALLQYKHITGDFFEFERAKTEETAQDPPKISVFLNEDLLQTIAEYGNKDKSPENYIFPIFEHGMTPLRQYKVGEQFVQFINKWMQRVLDALGIEKKAGCQVARHSYATVRRLGGADLNDIGDELGHSDPRTTRRYVGGLPSERKKENAAQLDAFKRKKKDDQAA